MLAAEPEPADGVDDGVLVEPGDGMGVLLAAVVCLDGVPDPTGDQSAEPEPVDGVTDALLAAVVCLDGVPDPTGDQSAEPKPVDGVTDGSPDTEGESALGSS